MNGIQAARAAYANRGGANNSNNQQQYRDEDYDINNPLGNNNAVNKTKVDEAMKILQNADPNYLRNIVEPSNTPQFAIDNAQAISMMQRLEQLEKENGTLRDVLVQQQKSMLERMSDSESRIMSEVQRRVELEMEVRVKNKAADVGTSVIEKRLAQMERIIEGQQNEIADFKEKSKRLDNNSRLLQIVQQRIDSAVQTVQSGTGGVKIVDEDLHRLKEIVKSREEQDREFQQREKRKGAVMFGEVTRLGKIVETSSERMGKGLSLLQKRIEGLELRLKSDERGIMAMEGRDAEKFSAVAKRAEDLEKHLMELSEATLRQRAIVDNESAERRRLQSEQSSWMQEVRNALVQTDMEVSDKITNTLAQLANRMLSEREQMEERFKQLNNEMRQRNVAREEATLLERENIKARFKAIDEVLKKEQEVRTMDLRKNELDQSKNHESLSGAIQRIETSQAEGFRRVDSNSLKSVKEQQTALTEFRNAVEHNQSNLEEVVRAEIKARMREQQKMKLSSDTAISRLSANIEAARNEAAARLEGAMKALVSRADLVDEKIDSVQREMITTLANQSRSQALVNSEMLGRLDAVENREKADENEWEQAVESINARIDKYARASTDSISALQSVVGDHRRQADEAVSKLRADLSNDLKLMNGSVNTAMTQWSTDSHHETELLRTEAAKAFADLRRDLFVNKRDQTQAALHVCDKINDNFVLQECNFVIDRICNHIVGQISTEERENIRTELESEQIQGLLSDIIDKLEAEAALEEQQTHQIATEKRFEETFITMEARFSVVEENMHKETEERIAIIENNEARNQEEHEQLKKKCDGIASGITDTAVELEVANALSGILAQVSEVAVLDTLTTIQEETKVKLKDADDKVIKMQEIVKEQEEAQVEIKAHVEAVVGTFEQTKREEAAQWERSMRESEKFLEQDEVGIDDDNNALTTDDSDSMKQDKEKFTAKVDVADVGFPVRNESESGL